MNCGGGSNVCPLTDLRLGYLNLETVFVLHAYAPQSTLKWHLGFPERLIGFETVKYVHLMHINLSPDRIELQ